MRVGDFHAVDLDEEEVFESIGENGGVQLRDDFADCSCFAGPGRAGDVDTCSSAVSDGGAEERVDGVEFVGTAGEGVGNCGDVEVCSGLLEGRRVDVGGGEDAGA